MSDNLIRESANIKSSYDFELSIKRENDVIYNYTYPKNQKLEGIVFIIPGFGNDADKSYSKNLRDFIASTFKVVAISVDYHCIHSRLNSGATQILDRFDQELLKINLNELSIKLDENANLDIGQLFHYIDQEMQKKKLNGELDKEIKLFQTLTMQPAKGEYQNFGILQALDHINVLKDIKNKNLGFIDRYPTILMGSSHGAYIANLIAKIIPNSIDCVIDNSSYIKPPLNYIIGKEDDLHFPEFRVNYGENVFVNMFTKTMWSKNEKSFYHFSQDNYDIRDLSNKVHNELMSKKSNSNTKYISYHFKDDDIAPYEDKEKFYKELSALGFDTTLKTISEDSQVDGKFIKSLKHGFDMSMKELANIELPGVLKIRSDSSEHDIEPVTYQCKSVNYNFEDINGIFSAILSPTENIEEKVIEIFNKNMEYFEKYQPNVYSKLASLDSAVEQGLYNNKYDLIFNNNYFDVKEFATNNYLYSDNSKKYAYEVSKKFNKSVDKFIFFGVGLGLHIVQIDKNIGAKSYLIIEDDLELFKLSTFVIPYYEIAKNSKLYFSVFAEENEFSKIAKEFFEDLKYGQKTVDSFEMNSNYKNQIFLLNNIIGELNG
ncbi:DUF2920 family protein [Sulfurimonas sp.]|uniref:DUF2920 family protein n=1 Tax=Sulfurimonas sp. TaxID=2022749 RepID=UPI0035647597